MHHGANRLDGGDVDDDCGGDDGADNDGGGDCGDIKHIFCIIKQRSIAFAFIQIFFVYSKSFQGTVSIRIMPAFSSYGTGQYLIILSIKLQYLII